MCSVEQELWRIFTFYALHSDANNPDVWKIANFVRFAKDCQMVSTKLPVAQIELEIVRLARRKRQLLGLPGVVDTNQTITLEFSDFFGLLEVFAIKVNQGFSWYILRY